MHLSNFSHNLRTTSAAAGSGNITFLVNTVIPYSGATPSIAGWQRWSLADGTNLFGSSSTPGATTSAAGQPSASGTMSSAGAHTNLGASQFRSYWTNNGSNLPRSSVSGFGNHNHANFFIGGFSLAPRQAQFNFLIATTSQKTLPQNSMVFSSKNNSSLGSLYSSQFPTYITGNSLGTGTIINGTTSQTRTGSSFSAGAHIHGTVNAGVQSEPGFNTGPRLTVSTSGAHTHTYSVTYSQTIFGPTVILPLYRTLSTLPPTNDIIVGFVGNLNEIRPPWYLCDGLNGTVNLIDKFVAVNNNAAPGTLLNTDLFSNNILETGSISSHGHTGTDALTGSGIFWDHFSASWSHSHSFTPTYNDNPAIASKIHLRFIQYKD
jgi:hypothetical protein